VTDVSPYDHQSTQQLIERLILGTRLGRRLPQHLQLHFDGVLPLSAGRQATMPLKVPRVPAHIYTYIVSDTVMLDQWVIIM
jgi:hypothetical protein